MILDQLSFPIKLQYVKWLGYQKFSQRKLEDKLLINVTWIKYEIFLLLIAYLYLSSFCSKSLIFVECQV